MAEIAAPLSAAAAVAAGAELDQLRVDARGLWWRESDPHSGRHRLRHLPHGATRAHDITPAGHSVRSRVHEYGGGDWCLAGDLLCYTREQDQQIYLQQPGAEARQLTALPDCRFNGLCYDPAHKAVVAVCERHQGDTVHNSLVMIKLACGRISTLHSGHDFYTMPALSADGSALAVIVWDHPQQPWRCNRLLYCRRNSDGSPGSLTYSQGEESFLQPRFSADGQLHAVTDRSGWWNLHRYDRQQNDWLNTAPLSCDCGFAQWQCGPSVWDRQDTGGLAFCGMQDGEGKLFHLGPDGSFADLSLSEFCLYREICCHADRVYLIAYARDQAAAVISIDLHKRRQQLHYRLPNPLSGPLSRARAFSFPVEDTRSHGFFYPPATATTIQAHKPPPLLIFTHGGPSAACYPVLNPKIQFWTQRGFAVADINYRGSTGYGRDYRLSLAGQWGQSDVADCVAAADYLARAGLSDARRVFIRGSSAGGFTTLCALAFTSRFAGGASLYGVSDPLALIKATHKFESHYLQWLIGDPQTDLERYRERTPLLHAGRIRTPVIFFQGRRDPVVVPQQTADMVAALQAAQVPVKCLYFDEEAHGFRQPANNARVLEEELAFYQGILSRSAAE
ncbi:S9 family peptidase [Granulosicoccaceae sp. 1_MG-2023]|nr:S9 family peptidase [Granulosicoccaceae sp. 1_MG-2023]